MKSFYAEALELRKQNNLYRQPKKVPGTEVPGLVNFAANDYFGLSQNLTVKKAALAALEKYGVGAGASRYVTGNNPLYTKLERQLARVKNCDDAVVFSSGYSVAIGAIPALAEEGDLIIADRLIHASLLDAAKLSGARLMRFLHNDVAHAQNILKEQRHKFKKCLIITESIFSMDGDKAPLPKLHKLAQQFNALLIVDDAHGLFAETLVTKNAENIIIFGTLSKALGALGGYVAGDKVLIEYLRNFARSQIYSTALPPAILAAALAALQIIIKKNLAQKTLKNAEYFCDLMKLEKPHSAIIPVIIGDAKKTLTIAKNLEEKGFLVGAIRYPTVEKNKARLRITFSSQHKKLQIRKLASALEKLLAPEC